MKNHWSLKFLAFLMAVVAGVMVVMGASGVVLSEETGFAESRQEIYDSSQLYTAAERASEAVVGTYACQLAGVSQDFFRGYIYWDYPLLSELDFEFDYRLIDDYGRTLENTRGSSSDYYWIYTIEDYVVHSTTVEMPELSYYPEYDEIMDYMVDDEIDPVMIDQFEMLIGADADAFPALTAGTYAYAYGYENGKTYRIDYTGTDRFQVEICLTEEQVISICGTDSQQITPLAQQFRSTEMSSYMVLMVCGFLLLALSVVWLCVMAGKSIGSAQLHPGGLNRIPLDLYTLAALCAGTLLAVLTVDGLNSAIWVEEGEIWIWILCMTALGAGLGLIVAMYLMAFAAQWKMEDGYWLKNTLCGRCTDWCMGGGRKILRWCGSKLRAFARIAGSVFDMMPLVWQWLAVGGGMALAMLMTFYLAVGRSSYIRYNFFFTLLLLLEVILCAGAIVYSAYCFGKLRSAANNMAQGNLNAKIDTEKEYLYGCFQEFSEDLNVLGDVCVEAAKRQMKSERMRSELITNVSHDIKTPLTSIINYVDLVQHCQTEEQRREYLAVLDRQSHQLKKLIEDLMEMSKASSGNISTEIVPTDVTEAVKQALGEFCDRLEQRQLRVVYRSAEEPMMAQCDGKLLWRVMSNLLTNVVKYALPGTRVYVDLARRDQRVEFSLKNISAEPLNISADELVERFVRGDESRNTEGNGLGLNIARSLMEVQGGTLELVVDGDLFKAVLSLPAV